MYPYKFSTITSNGRMDVEHYNNTQMNVLLMKYKMNRGFELPNSYLFI